MISCLLGEMELYAGVFLHRFKFSELRRSTWKLKQVQYVILLHSLGLKDQRQVDSHSSIFGHEEASLSRVTTTCDMPSALQPRRPYRVCFPAAHFVPSASSHNHKSFLQFYLRASVNTVARITEEFLVCHIHSAGLVRSSISQVALISLAHPSDASHQRAQRRSPTPALHCPRSSTFLRRAKSNNHLG